MEVENQFFDLLTELVVPLVALIAAILGVVVIFAQRQLKFRRVRPKYRIGTIPDTIELTLQRGGLPIDKKTEKRLQGDHLFYPVFLDKREQKKFNPKFHLFYFPICIENKGNSPIEHLQVTLIYPNRHAVDYNEISNEISGGDCYQITEDGHAQTYSISQSKDRDPPFERHVASMHSSANVVYNFPIIRPGEQLTVYEALKFTHEDASLFAEAQQQFCGYDAIAAKINEIEDVRNNFPIIAFFRSASHQPVVRRAIVFSIHGDKNNSSKVIKEYVRAHWLGRLPQGGRYFPPPFGFTWLLRKLGVCGALSRSMTREHPMIFHSTNPLYKKMENGDFFSFDERGPQLIGFASLRMPNIDFFKIPDHVKNPNDLINWLWWHPAPKFFGGPDLEAKKGKDSK